MDPAPRRIVVALGGNAISSAAHTDDIDAQFANSIHTAKHIADLICAGHHILLTHGNGPQVGATLRRVELSRHEVYPIPLALCVANTQAGMGYMICECIRNEMWSRGRSVPVCTVITSVVVDPDDEAFLRPTKQIGPEYDDLTARARVESDGWTVTRTPSGRYRRVVPSPAPKRIQEIELIRHLFDEGRVVVCGGGGGIPVARGPSGRTQRIDAVIDKDLTTALLAVAARADTLAILTRDEHVCLHFGTPDEVKLRTLTIPEAHARLAEGQFGEGTMAPKIRAAIQFLEETEADDPTVIITSTDKCLQALRGETGTRILRAQR